MSDINIKDKKLENLIIILEKDNEKIVDLINSIYVLMKDIDKNEWDSPGKTRLDNNFIPYLKRQEEIVKSNLESKTKILKEALDLYRKNNNILEKKVENLEGL